MIRYLFYSILLNMLAWSLPATAQSSSNLAFNQAANYFIEGQNQQALQTVNNALKKHPNDAKLQALREKLEEQQQKEQEQQQQNQQEGENKEEDKGEQQNGEDQNQEEQDKQDEQQEGEQEQQEGEEKGEENKEDDGEENDGDEESQQQEGREGEQEGEDGMQETERRLREMNISPEKAQMILEAMKSNEIQYLQQKKRRQNRRSGNGKPDW